MKHKYNLIIASDHSGYALKTKIIEHFNKIAILDCGVNDSNTRVDYPDYAKKLIDLILDKTAPFGILICSTGIGMSIAANRSSHIRAALCTNIFMAEMSRSHNDANVLVLGSKVISESIAIEIVDKFLSTDFEGGRHSYRIAKLSF